MSSPTNQSAIPYLYRFLPTLLTVVVSAYLGIGLSCAETNRTIEFELPIVSEAPDDFGFAAWKYSQSPTSADITIKPDPDPDLASLVGSLLKGQVDSDIEDVPGKLKKGIAQGMIPFGEQTAAIEKEIVVSGFDGVPDEATEGQTITLKIKIIVPQLPPTDKIELYLVSKSCSEFDAIFRSPTLPPGFILSEPSTLLESSGSYGLKISDSTDTVRRAMTSQAIFSPGDVEEFGIRNGLGKAESKQKLTEQYEALAAQYLTKLHDAKITPGPRIQDKVARNKADEIHRLIQSGFADKVRVGYERKIVRIFFPGFGLRKSTQILVPDDNEFQEELNKRYLDFSREGSKRRLLMDGTRLPSAMMIEADLIYLRADPLIGTVRPQFSDDQIKYTCTPKPLSSSKVTIGAGLEFTPERKLTPLLGLQIPATSEDESDLSFELSGGKNSISGEAEYLFPIKPAMTTSLWDSTQGVIRGGADDFTDARYGNTIRGGVDSFETGVSAGWILRFDSYGHSHRFEATQPTKEGLNGRVFRTVEAGFRYRNVDLDGPAIDLVGLDQEARSGPYIDARVLFGKDMGIGGSHKQWDSWWVEGRLAIDTSFQAFGGSADYLRIFGQLDARRQWSITDSLNAQGSVGLTGAWVSGGTPTFDFFGSGQDGMIRGLRDTEFIGRSYIGMHADLGFDITSLLNGSNGEVTEQTSPNDPKMHILFGPFADAGWLYDRISNGRHVSGGKALQSFGVQLQMLQTSILNAPTTMSFGYAWSPQSELDKSGSVFSKVSISF